MDNDNSDQEGPLISDDITEIINAPIEISAAPLEIITFPASDDEGNESGDDLPALSDERDESGDILLTAWIVIALISNDITEIINAPIEISAAPKEIMTLPASDDECNESDDDLPALSDECDESGDILLSPWIVIALISDDITEIINAPIEISAALIENSYLTASNDERDKSGDDLLALSDERFESGEDLPALSVESGDEGGCEQEKGDCEEDHE